ncbi:ankyrin [Aureobasidium pullulans]|nr:ankyrin [Aureobasidium pullulans]
MEITPADLSEDDSRGLLAHISKYQPERVHHKIKLLKVFNTTQWIIKDFESFMSSIARPQTQQQPNQNCLWVSGINHHDKQSSRGFVAHVYFDSEKRDSLKATDLFRSYVKQFLRHLYTRRQKPPKDVILALRRMFGSRVSDPSCSEVLRELLLPLISEAAGTVLVVDGLDLCARDEYLVALACFASILELTSAKVVICGRDELDIKSRLPGSTRLEVSAARNQDDIAVYVKHHVEKRSIYDGPISNNSNTVTQIIETLINKANGMFLWARLQIDVLWDTCRTDAEIFVALKELPKNLDETYEKCLERLRRKQEPRFLESSRAGVLKQLEFHAWEDSELKLGEMCILHLCWHMNVAIEREDQTSHKIEATTLLFPAISQMSNWIRPQGTIAYLQRPSLMWTKKTKFSHSPVVIKRLVTKPSRTAAARSFQQYARSNWLTLSYSTSSDSVLWKQFWPLVLEHPNDPQICPWNRDRMVAVVDIIWWAIDHSHVALFDIAVLRSSILNTESRPDFDIPLARYEKLRPLHLAAKQGSLEIFIRLLNLCSIDESHPVNGWTALHYAAEQGHSEIVKLLLQATSASVRVMLRGNDGHSALSLAVKAQSHETIKVIEALCGHLVWQAEVIDGVLNALLIGERRLEFANHVLLRVTSVRGYSHSKLLTWIVKHGLASLVPGVVKAGVPLDTPINSKGISSRELYSDEPEIVCAAVFFALEASTSDLATALIMNGAGRSVHSIYNHQIWKPFHLAMSRGWASLASSLLDSGDFTRTLTPRYVRTIRFRISVTNPCVRWLSVVCPIYGSIDGFTIASSSQDALVGQCYPNVLHVVKVRGADNDIHELEVELCLDELFGFHLMIGTPEADFTAWRKRPTPSNRSQADLQRIGTLVKILHNGTVKEFRDSPSPYNTHHVQLIDNVMRSGHFG